MLGIWTFFRILPMIQKSTPRIKLDLNSNKVISKQNVIANKNGPKSIWIQKSIWLFFMRAGKHEKY